MSHRIAIIEDELPILDMYRLKLERAGFEVMTATNGKDGLELIHLFLPELVLLDLRMPIMSGEEMLTRLRNTDWGSTMRVIILTNISKSEAPQSLRLLHVDTYAVKAHYTPSQVVDLVKDVLDIEQSVS